MPANILNGAKIAAQSRLELKALIENHVNTGYRPPAVAVILVGDDKPSSVYVHNKQKDCLEVGIRFHLKQFSKDVTQSELISTIHALNAKEDIDGILIQLPLPNHLIPTSIIDHINPDKDIDGFHPYNIGRLAVRSPNLRPCTPKGIMHLLSTVYKDLKGKHAVVVGASNHVGRPMMLELLLAGCTTTSTHKFTHDLPSRINEAEILIVAVGRPQFIKGSWIKDGSVVIDVGINHISGNRICGDVEFSSAKERASWITPVPGGVGPMTRLALLQNTCIVYESRISDLSKT